MSLWISRLDDADFHVKLNLVMICIWGFLFIPSLLWWKESIIWLVFMSCYANFVGHVSAWVASKAEVEAKTSDNMDSDASG